ncbi:hypothetical protein Tco_0235626, partial [Tanacetum coccineum]
MKKLNLNRTFIRRYPEEFLCIVGLSRSFFELDVRPTLLGSDKNDMGLLYFVKSVDPFKVKVGERTLDECKVPLLTEITDMVVVPSDKAVRLVSHTIGDEIREHSGKNKRKVGFSTVLSPVKKVRDGGVVITEPVVTTAGKSLVVIQKLITQSVQANIGSGSVASHAKEFVSSSVTPTLDR